jgi:hypothetical protein
MRASTPPLRFGFWLTLFIWGTLAFNIVDAGVRALFRE